MSRLVTDYLDKTRIKYPNKVAFIDDKRQITFSELYDEACSIASILIGKGLKKEPVLMFMDKSVSLISSFIGTAYSGNFYSPVDTKMPKERILKILNTLKPSVIITDRAHTGELSDITSDIDVLVFEDMISVQPEPEIV